MEDKSNGIQYGNIIYKTTIKAMFIVSGSFCSTIDYGLHLQGTSTPPVGMHNAAEAKKCVFSPIPNCVHF